MSLVSRPHVPLKRGLAGAAWAGVGTAVGLGVGRVVAVLPSWCLVSGGIFGVSIGAVAAAPELTLGALLVIKQLAPLNVSIMMLSIAMATAAVLAGGWRRLPPVPAIAFGIFLVISLPTVHTTLPPWDSIQEFSLIGTDWEVFPVTSYDILNTLSLVNIAGAAVLAAHVVRQRDQLDRFWLALTLGASYPILIGLKDRVTGNLAYHDGTYSIQSVFGHPNAFAVYLVAVVPLMAASAIHSRAPLQRYLAGGLAFLGTACLLLTFSRSGWMAFAIAVLIAAVMAGKVRHVFAIGGVVAVLAVAAGAAGPVVDRFSGLGDTPSASTYVPGNSWSWRLVTWSRVLEQTPSWQLTGSGYGSYETRTVEVFGLTGGQIGTTLARDWRHGFGAHNDFVEQYVETGIPGLLLWSTFILGILGTAAKVWVRTRDFLALGVLTSAVGLIVMSFSDNVQAYDVGWFLVAGAAAALWAAHRSDRQEDHDTPAGIELVDHNTDDSSRDDDRSRLTRAT